jgi:hypothetical protein
MYAIFENKTWLRASPSHAAYVATTANNDAKVSPDALKNLPDSTLVAWGVRRLDEGTKPPLLKYQNYSPADISLSGDRATQSWVAIDYEMTQARNLAYHEVERLANVKRLQDVAVNQDGVVYQFPMGPDNIQHYSTLGAALGSGVDFPEAGIPFPVNHAEKRIRLRVNADQWKIVVHAMTETLVTINEREVALEDAVADATNLSELRAIDMEAGW